MPREQAAQANRADQSHNVTNLMQRALLQQLLLYGAITLQQTRHTLLTDTAISVPTCARQVFLHEGSKRLLHGGAREPRN
eukprot:4492229-Amphidinium_carterae.1